MDVKDMRTWMLLAWTAGALQAVTLRGTVVENQTGRPLARAEVVAEPLSGGAEKRVSTRANLYGAFEFPALPGGAYLITASRRGFASVQFGQKRFQAAGAVVTLEASGTKTVSIRLPRLGAISGTVFDENDVGLPEHDVVAYRSARPPQLVARARTDDRGHYRVSGLEPGKYFVRTVAKEYEQGGYLPTFYPQTQRIDQAYLVDAELDQETPEINVHPASGRLVAVSGQVSPPASITVSLVSDSGAETTASDAAGAFQFGPIAPGAYELYAQGASEARTGAVQAAYQPLTLDRDRADIRLTLRPLPQVQFILKDTRGQTVDPHTVWVMARRKDLAGIGKIQALQLSGDRLAFLPGRWDLALAPPEGYYISGLSTARGPGGEASRADGWREFLLSGNAETLQFVLSAAPGAVHGRVTGPGHAPAAGAPVYLEAYDPVSRRRLRDLQITRADSAGQYAFPDLAPGSYRVLSSFDLQAPDASLEVAGVRMLRVEEARDTAQDLDLFEIR